MGDLQTGQLRAVRSVVHSAEHHHDGQPSVPQDVRGPCVARLNPVGQFVKLWTKVFARFMPSL